MCQGAFQSPFIIETLAYHFALTGELAPDSKDVYPYGALALATTAVCTSRCLLLELIGKPSGRIQIWYNLPVFRAVRAVGVSDSTSCDYHRIWTGACCKTA